MDMKVKTKKPNKTSLKKKCDILYSLIIRSKGYCEVCNPSNRPSSIQLNAHHIIGRGTMILRYDFRNGCCLCVNCHEFSRDSVKNNPIKFLRWMEKNRPDDLVYVESKSELIAHYSVENYQNILQHLKEVYSEMQIP
jgi:hypothetical protein